ncbi:CAI-1 autoinducer sensor kinase/phosphatase CqsS [Paraburkholderia domus]|uniref:ATP-binding response regulator n=1 Tax=Paraburkholderia domus TaxID=2793075 RepID=UPI001911BEAA|nr:hybrid sensor histidine kinase/response regulator [Paraburkholderia domus]MBK5061200.1 response regulator [Burkholderia sp. R-70199]MBK5090714.1 response regulator [Burkholderia sp. R-69927]CAE6884607.1 CAI-1 autoinducer sensor kinase/phosphatase CqsS [Paraburkholderia domus]CAE6922062.1 CAI-1 autoinducer sensor kinase/phosphatase CqsS [Paraburkholderia domus]
MVIPRESMRDVLERSRLAIRWGGILGLLCHPIYFVVWTYVLPQPYDNLFLRLSAAAVCIPLIFQAHWPKRFNRHLLIYWHCCLIYVLPFACTFLAIRNSFSTMWMMTEVMMIFIMALCIDNPLLLMTCIGIGVLSGTLAAVATSPAPIVLSPANQSDLALLPVVVLCSMAFSYAINKGRIFVEKNRALKALAGSIAHEMRNPLSQLKHVLDRVEEALPATTESDRAPVLSHNSAALLYRHLAHGQLSIERGLRIIAMTLDEVSAKPIRSDYLTYLSAASTTRKALDEYGFGDKKERSKVRLVVLEDFTFKVDETVYLFTLFNLIKNALHHIVTHPLATLTLTVDRQSVIVRDTGTGISPDILPHLFEPFRTAGDSAGTGLGLAYCQRAMRAFGGTISCRSEVGKFTQFTLQFPVVSESEVADHERKIVERAIPIFNGKHILVVDDDAAQRAGSRRALSKVGAQVSEAENGQIALSMLRQSSAYDLVLMDVNMPILDGYTTTEKIRADHENPNRDVLISAYTAEPGNVVRVLARRAGMDEIIRKSHSTVELITSLQTLFENGSRHHLSHRFDGFADKSILVADDDTYSRLVTKAYLERFGASVVEAEHGQAVLAQLQDGDTVDAIVMDMNMPGMGGVETTASIRARTDSYANVPIIALTSQSDIGAVQACLDAGMNEVMVKPVQVGSLYACLARQFSQQRVSNAPTKAALSQPSAKSTGKLSTIEEADLLDEKHLEELTTLDLLDQSFLNGIEQIRSLVARLATSAAARDFGSMRGELHLLLGISGNIGAKALHQFARQLYPRIVEGEWPSEPDWVTRICMLGGRSADALQTYFASDKASRDHRDVMND